jgi:hypothetical protein
MHFSLERSKIQLSEFTIKYAKTEKILVIAGAFSP